MSTALDITPPHAWSKDYVRLTPESGVLMLPSDHMVYAGHAFEAAATVEPGDRLLWNNEPVQVLLARTQGARYDGHPFLLLPARLS